MENPKEKESENEDSGPMSSEEFYPPPPETVGTTDSPQVLGEVSDEEVDGEDGDKGGPHPFSLFEPVGQRIVDALFKSSFKTLEALHNATDEDLKAIKGIGARSINPIRGLLASQGFEEKNALPQVEATEIGVQARKAAVDQAREDFVKQQPHPHIPPEYDPEKAYVSTGNIVFSDWEGGKYQYVINQSLSDAPESLIKEMVSRGEAKEA